MRRGVTSLIGLCLLLAAGLPSAAPAQDLDKMMESAHSAYEKGRYAEAFEKYQAAHQAAAGSSVKPILGALEASLALGRYDGIITAVGGASAEDPADQAHIDALIGRAHFLTTYVLDPTLSDDKREALRAEHLKRANTRLAKAGEGSGEWATRAVRPRRHES